MFLQQIWQKELQNSWYLLQDLQLPCDSEVSHRGAPAFFLWSREISKRSWNRACGNKNNGHTQAHLLLLQKRIANRKVHWLLLIILYSFYIYFISATPNTPKFGRVRTEIEPVGLDLVFTMALFLHVVWALIRFLLLHSPLWYAAPICK